MSTYDESEAVEECGCVYMEDRYFMFYITRDRSYKKRCAKHQEEFQAETKRADEERQRQKEEQERRKQEHKELILSIPVGEMVTISQAVKKYNSGAHCASSDRTVYQSMKTTYKDILHCVERHNAWYCSSDRLEKIDFSLI